MLTTLVYNHLNKVTSLKFRERKNRIKRKAERVSEWIKQNVNSERIETKGKGCRWRLYPKTFIYNAIYCTVLCRAVLCCAKSVDSIRLSSTKIYMLQKYCILKPLYYCRFSFSIRMNATISMVNYNTLLLFYIKLSNFYPFYPSWFNFVLSGINCRQMLHSLMYPNKKDFPSKLNYLKSLFVHIVWFCYSNAFSQKKFPSYCIKMLIII